MPHRRPNLGDVIQGGQDGVSSRRSKASRLGSTKRYLLRLGKSASQITANVKTARVLRVRHAFPTLAQASL
jgi:hypothetical protein